jgi:hypothetical protein
MEEPATDARYPLNAPGPFYVENEHCIACGLPEVEAPDLMTNHEGHCYFRKQPSTRAELEQAVRAVQVCCCGSVRYGGDNLLIQLRISEPYQPHPNKP